MSAWRDRFNRMSGKTRFAVCRIFVHLAGNEAAPLLGVLNQAARDAVTAEGDMSALSEGLVEVCQSLLQYDLYWQSAANEGDVFWDEGDAGDYVTELFTDSAQRYGVEPDFNQSAADDPLEIPVTQNLVVILVVAYEGEAPALETDLADLNALKAGLKALINLDYDNRIRAIQVHYSPAQLGDVLTSEQLILNFPELIPL
jgi:hypothetical protein